MAQDMIYRNYAIRLNKRTDRYDVLEPHSDFLIKCGGFSHSEDAACFIDSDIERIRKANAADDEEFD